MRKLLYFILAASCGLSLQLGAREDLRAIDPDRIQQIADWLTPVPSTNYLPPFQDRAFWSAEADKPTGEALIAAAEEMATEPVPALTEALFEEYKATQRRHVFEVPYGERTARLCAFVYAYGMTLKEDYLALIETELGAILSEPSWALPGHTQSWMGWGDAYRFFDIAAASRVWSLATTDWLLQDALRPETRKLIRLEAQARVFDPYLLRSRLRRSDGFWWMNITNNWNAISHSGVVGAALLLCESPQERAEFIAAFEEYTKDFIRGFTDDGYCDEGIAYWNYGFSHYIYGSEAIRLATQGNLDLMSGDKLNQIVAFDQHWEMANGIFPAFGDAWFEPSLSPVVHDYAAIRFNSGYLLGRGNPVQHHIFGAFMYQILFDLSLDRESFVEGGLGDGKLRDWFPQGGALISRRIPSNEGFAVAMKGGHNDQSHNHNDLGSFVVVNNGALVLTDLGADAYTRDTFGANRYSSEIMNSYGHPVPLVAGKLQKLGREARAETVRVEFTEEQDLWEMDLSSAYDVPELLKLTRTFVFNRAQGGLLEIIDEVHFTSPQAFGNAIVFRRDQAYEWEDDQTLRTGNQGEFVRVRFECEQGGGLRFSEDDDLEGIIKSERSRGIRVGVDLKAPVMQARIRTLISPISSDVASGARLGAKAFE